jgi:hypothetical protein
MNATITTPAERTITVTMSETQARMLQALVGAMTMEHVDDILVDTQINTIDVFVDAVQSLYDALSDIL